MYCFFIIWVLNGYKNLIKDSAQQISYSSFVSVVVAARNEAHNLPILLKSLNEQSYPNN